MGANEETPQKAFAIWLSRCRMSQRFNFPISAQNPTAPAHGLGRLLHDLHYCVYSAVKEVKSMYSNSSNLSTGIGPDISWEDHSYPSPVLQMKICLTDWRR